MVYSSELGYDPDEWEECPAPDHFLALSMFTRVCLSIGTVVASVLFFWMLEANKRRNNNQQQESKTEQQQQQQKQRPSTEWEGEEETVESKFARAAEEAALKAQPERRRNSKRELSSAEEGELLAWKAEVQRTVETRLRASEEPTDSEEGQRRSRSRTTREEEERQMGDKEEEQKGGEERQRQTVGERGEERQREQIGDKKEEEKRGEERQRKQMGERGEERQREAEEEQQQQINGSAAKDDGNIRRPTEQPQQFPPLGQPTMEKPPEGEKAEFLMPMSEWAKTKQLVRVVEQSDDLCLYHPGATPPSTPPDGIGQTELAAQYRQMANELTQKLRKELDEMELEQMDSAQMAQHLQIRHRKDIAGGLEGTVASPEVRHRLARQLESHVAIVVAQEMRKRSSSSALAGQEEEKEAMAPAEPSEQKQATLKTASSSGENSEDDFVRVERQQMQSMDTMDHQSSRGAALRKVMHVNTTMDSGNDGQHGLTPSPQMEGPVTEEHEEQVRVSMFEGDGGSTTADEIEYVPIIVERSKRSELSPPLNERPKQRPLGAEEAEQMLALLQEYDLSAGEAAVADPMVVSEEQQQPLWGRQVSSGAMSSSGGVISLPGSTQRTTPAGSSSVPESPDSAAFGFVKIHPLADAEVNTTAEAEVHEQKEMPNSEMTKGFYEQQMDHHHLQKSFGMEETMANIEIEVEQKTGEEQQNGEKQKKETMGELERQQKEKQMQRKETIGKNAGGTVQSSSFIVEEEMLESAADELAEKVTQNKTDQKREQQQRGTTGEAQIADGAQQQFTLLKSPDTAEAGGGGSSATMATSRQIGTNEAFDRPADAALLFEDIDDKDVTYAPEIQSLEVPPDQLSQTDSLNLLDEEQFSEEHQRIIITDEEVGPQNAKEQQQHTAGKVGQRMERAEEEEEAEAPQRELTPHEEEKLQRIIDRLRRTPSPQRHRMSQPQLPQAPQFLRSYFNDESTSSLSSTFQSIRQSSLLSALGVTSTQEMLLRLTSLEALSDAMRKAGLESSNLIFGIDYTASNKYQGERSFGGQSLHSTDSQRDNPYQTVIKIMGRTLAPFAGHEHGIPVFGFGDSATGDWTVFSLNKEKDCENLEEVLSVYNRITPTIDLSGPTNFAPLIYRAMEICQQRRDYHILVIVADGQVTNEKATVKAIVSACQFPLSIIVVGVGDGPWEMMRIFDESLPKRPWDNFHFVELHELLNQRGDQPIESRELAFAVHSLLEIPDQYSTICKMGLLSSTAFFTRPPSHSPRRSKSPKAPQGIIRSKANNDEGTQGKETNC